MSDIVCPWCYIGKRRFEQALQALGQRDQVEVVHHSFELDPSMDRGQTVQLMDMLAAKYRLNPAQASEAESRVAATAAADGLGYTSDRPVGNTFDAHRLVHLAADRGRGEETLQRLYEAHFAEGKSVFDTDALTAVAADAGTGPRRGPPGADGRRLRRGGPGRRRSRRAPSVSPACRFSSWTASTGSPGPSPPP